VYLGDNFPAEYRNRVFMCNIHGNRINQDILQRHGSGYIAKHAPDFLMANDPWFRGLVLTAAADGGIFVADWHDEGECHNYEKTHPSGRVYKITYGTPKPFTDDLAKKSDEELAKLQAHRNDWHVRHARRLLQERASDGTLNRQELMKAIKARPWNTSTAQMLRAFWTLHVCGEYRVGTYAALMVGNPPQELRAWAARL